MKPVPQEIKAKEEARAKAEARVKADAKAREEAKAKAYALALYAVADDVEKSKDIPDSISIFPVSA